MSDAAVISATDLRKHYGEGKAVDGVSFEVAEWLRPVASVMPLTYLGDALRRVMVGGAAHAPLGIDVLVLGGWLVVSFLISARFFRWQ